MTDLSMPSKRGELKGWHVLIWMLCFFGLMFAVNGVFLYQAITSFPGEDVEKSYLQGLSYNDTLAARAAQAKLGWGAEVGVEGDQLVVVMFDADRAALSSLTVSALVHREYTTKNDQHLTLKPMGDGVYVAPLGELGRGRWSVDIDAATASDGGVVFEATQSFVQR